MPLFHAFVLGLLQGLAEFLPISSSAHLALAPTLFGWEEHGLAFDVALHTGTLVTLLWYFRRDWIALVQAAWQLVFPRPGALLDAHEGGGTHAAQERRRFVPVNEEQRRVVLLVLATIPAAIGGLLLEDYAETVFRSPWLNAVMLMVMGVILWAADRFAAQDRPLGDMRWRDALLIGLAQVCALVPGVSRSGSTMTAGRALRFERASAARFSFLMSMPITAAAVVLKAPEAMQVDGIGAAMAVGIVTAAISSWIAIAFLLRYLTRHGFGVFALYRLALGAFVLYLVAQRGGQG